MNQRNFFAELKRRKVYKVAVAYIVAGWALSQGTAQVFPVFDIPNWAIRLINLLSKVPGLRVPGRTSCFAFKGKNEEDIFRKVGDQLHVGTVLEGSVRKAGDQLRVTAQLINVSDGYHLWSKDYDGDVKNIFAFQSNVAKRVVEALQVKLGGEAARALAKKPTENQEAHRLYLLGRYEFGKYSEAHWTS